MEKVTRAKASFIGFKIKKQNNNWSEEQRKAAFNRFSGAVGLALIPFSQVESVWTNIIDEFSLAIPPAQN